VRDHDLRGLTDGELERAGRELRASLALARPDSPARVPILARLDAVGTELAARTTRRGADAAPRAPVVCCARAGSAPMTGSGLTATCSTIPAITSGQGSPLPP